MMTVRVNMNGDSAESLLEELRVVHSAIVSAQAAMGRLTVHQRNYQTCADPVGDYQADYYCKWTNVSALADVERYIVGCFMIVDAQLPAKGSQQ